MKEIVFKCDVCGFKRHKELDNMPNDWKFVYYGEEWQDGSHKGVGSRKFLACKNCLNGTPKFFGFLLNVFKPCN
jgi:hypothetical protein